MHWTAIAQGLVTALLVSGLFASRKHVKNLLLQRQIKRMLDGANLGRSVVGLTTRVRNKSQVELRVHEVFLLTPGMRFQFQPNGEESMDHHIKELLTGSDPKPATAGPFPSVPPLTNYSYLLPASLAAQIKGSVSGISIKVDYDSYTGRRKIVEVQSSEWANEMSRKTIAQFQEDLQSGNLNNARTQRGLPPVPPASPSV